MRRKAIRLYPTQSSLLSLPGAYIPSLPGPFTCRTRQVVEDRISLPQVFFFPVGIGFGSFKLGGRFLNSRTPLRLHHRVENARLLPFSFPSRTIMCRTFNFLAPHMAPPSLASLQWKWITALEIPSPPAFVPPSSDFLDASERWDAF